MHPKHAKIKINISACVINLFYAPQFETGWLHLKASWIWARNGTNHRHLFLVGKMTVVVWYLSLILSHFIILSESHTSPESYFPHHLPYYDPCLLSSVQSIWIYGSDDYQLLLTASQNLIASIHNFLLASWGHLSFYTGTSDFPWDLWWPSEQQVML